MNIRYRKAEKSDFKYINSLFIEMLNTIYHREDSKGYLEHDLDYYFENKQDWICIASDEDKVVGFLSIEVHQEDSFIYLDDFSVTKDYRNKGIGKTLISKAEEYAKEIGINVVLLHVEASNSAAYDLYKKLGYFVSQKQDHRLLMKKEL